MTRYRSQFFAGLVAALTVAALSGCAILAPFLVSGQEPNPAKHRSTSGGIAKGDLPGPDGWKLFDHCAGAPDYDYTFVEGLPYEQLEEAAIVPDCGDVWKQDDGRHFLNVTSYAVTVKQLDALRGALIDQGWDETVSETKGDVLVARDYYLGDDNLTRFAIELYLNSDGTTYTAYMDYLSPATRLLFG
jgi:hypothetical protein